MIEASLAIQGTIRARLTASDDVLAHVPASAILDSNGRPERFPCIIVGDGHTAHADDYETFHDTVVADLHVWADEPGLSNAKVIAGAVRAALRRPPWAVQGHRCHALRVTATRFLRDPNGKNSHAVVTVEAILQEVAA